MHYYKKNIGDYHKKAGRLTMIEHGAYTLLLDACYDREEFPTLEDALDWTWARTEAEIEAVKFVLSKFFTLTDGKYVQNRVMEELSEYKAKAETNARIAKEREEKRKASKQSVHEPCTPPNHKPLTINQEPLLNIQQPHTDSRTMFEMSLDWKPTANINGVLRFTGLPWSIDTIPNDRFVEFVTHWHGKPNRKTQDGWHSALVRWLKRTQISPASSARCRPVAPTN